MDYRYNPALNAISPYFTMFPLSFPYEVLSDRDNRKGWVLDPFCGRGTTNFAARLNNVPSVGIDCSPIATALTHAKLVNTTADVIIREAHYILDNVEATTIPDGEFWNIAYHKDVLRDICKLRESLLADCTTDSKKALRAIVMGALHGPQNKRLQTYFSNQSPRTYAPKPAYAVNYWRKRGLKAYKVNVLDIIATRAHRYYDHIIPEGLGLVVTGNSADNGTWRIIQEEDIHFSTIVTSPPYFGMSTYIPDQWLRNWFVGGPSYVEYSSAGQLGKLNVEQFTNQLRSVWFNTRTVSDDEALLVIRFGGINDKRESPMEIIEESLNGSGWRIIKIRDAGDSRKGRRQADYFVKEPMEPINEIDVFCKAA